MIRTRGTVTFWKITHGFIKLLGSEQGNIFVHFSQIQGDGYRSLYPGDTVEFNLVDTPKGLAAQGVRRVR